MNEPDIRTEAEKRAGITVVNAAYPPGDVRRYGAIGDDHTDDTWAVVALMNMLQAGGA